MDTDGLDRNKRAQEALIYLLLTSLGEATEISRPHSATLASLTRRGLLTRNEQGFHALTNGGLWWTGWFIGFSRPWIKEVVSRKQIIETAHFMAEKENVRCAS